MLKYEFLTTFKNTNIKIFNLMSRTNETKHIKWHKTCKCKCRLDANVCNNKQRWNKDKCECKELIDKGMCDKGFVWNPSCCKYEYDKSYDIGEYLDYKNCKCKKRIIDKLVAECSENIYENKTLDVIPLNVYKKVFNSCMVYIVLFIVFLITIICTSCVFIYFYWYLKKDNVSTNFSVGYLNI